MQILLQCGQEVPNRHEDVEISPSLFSCALSTPCEVDDLSQICPLPGMCYGAKVDIHSHKFPGIDVNLAVSLNRFLRPHHVVVVQQIFVGGDSCLTF